MRLFTDKNGAEWQLVIDVAGVGRVMGMTGVNLYKAFDIDEEGNWLSEDMRRMNDDIFLRASVVHALCAPQAAAREISRDQFIAALNMETLDKLWEGDFLRELLDFFPPAKRKLAETMLTALEQAGEAMQKQAMEALERKIAAAGISPSGTETSSASAAPSASAPAE